MTSDETFAACLKRLRVERAMSFAQVAAAVDVAENTVRAWEAGRQIPNGKYLGPLAIVLGVKVVDLVRGLS